MDKFDYGEFGELTPEEALKEMQKFQKDYKSLEKEFTQRSQALKEHEEFAQVVNLINDLGLGDQVASMIMQAQTGRGTQGYPPEYGPQAYQQEQPPSDPYLMDAMAEIDELKQQLQGMQQMYWGDRAQRDIADFKATHSDLTEEQVDEIGRYMIDNQFPTLDSAYKYMHYNDHMEAARLDGEKRMQEQMTVKKGEGEGHPTLSGGEGGLQTEDGKPPARDWRAAKKAALEDAQESGLLD